MSREPRAVRWQRPDESPTPAQSGGSSGRPYTAPRLTSLGDLRGLTFGGSPGVNDSGSLFVQEPPV